MRLQNDKDNTEIGSRTKKLSEIARNITMIGQLGLSLVVPVLLCMFLCHYLVRRFAVGAWVYIPGLILGIGSSCMTAWKTYQSAVKDSRESEKDSDRGPSFSRHY